MFLKLDQEGLLYGQVYRALRRQILGGRMRPGSRLPSTRWLASELGISRNTALLAYEQLIAEGYLAAGSHAGTYVAAELPENLTFVAPDQASRKHAVPSAVRLSSFAARIADDPVNAALIREILLRPALPYDFRYGRPSFADFPHATWDRTLARRARRRSIGDLDYGAPEGVAALRNELADYLHRARAVNCSPEQILIVSGSQQAIDLAVRVLIDRGDRVVLENPHYFPARNVSRAAGAALEFVDVDDQGMKLSDLAAKSGRVKLVFVTPSHQFPTGALMPLGRRLELLAWANRTGAVVFEDDYDSEYRYSGRPVEALQALDESGRVLYSGTFSKTMFPGLRLGYVVVPNQLVDIFRSVKSLLDTACPTNTQLALAEFMRDGHFERHLRRSRARNAQRRAVLLESIERTLGDQVEVSGAEGGLHILLWLKDMPMRRSADLIARAEQAGVGVYPVSPFYSKPPKRSGLLLGYTSLTEKEIAEGIRRLGPVVASMSAAMLGKYMRYPFADGNYSLALGLVPMAEETWLDIDEHYADEMSEKARRLRDEYAAVFRALPGSERGQAEVLAMLLEHLSVYYPNFFRISRGATAPSVEGGVTPPDTRIENLINGETWRVGDFDAAPLDLAGRLIQEDLCLMSPDGKGTYVLSAGSVCFPLRWELADKFGLPMAGIHHAVPGYDEKLAAPSDRYMVGLKAHKPSWRSNWSIVDAPDLYLKQRRFAQGHNSDITAQNAGRKLWIRSERQSLRRLPRSGDVLFTIRTYIRPLSVLESLPSVARGLAQALDKVPPEMRGYKNQLPIRDALLAYLSRIAG